ncbi:MAG: hypothetical protein KY439_09145 [Actinobacteria bacterium]|nr:hypothetical protein [Actinomycetota bacterium]
MVDFVVYVDWPQEGARDDALRSINDAWPQDDESFCSSMEADVVELSFGLAAASYEEAARLAIARVRVLDSLLTGAPAKVTVYSDDGYFVQELE